MKTWIRPASCVAACLILTACRPSPAERKREAAEARQACLAWNKKTLVDAYQQAGHTDTRWDDPAKAALTEFARVCSFSTDTNEDPGSIISNNCASAMETGCNDPMIHYLYVRYDMAPSESEEKKGEYAEALCKAAVDLDSSGYPDARKFFAWYRAGQQINETYGYGTNIPQKLHAMDPWWHEQMSFLGAIADKTMPPEEVYEAAHQVMEVWKWKKEQYDALYQRVESEVADKRAKTPVLLLLKGEYYTQTAWLARGSGYSSTVTADGWKGFSKNLDLAEKALTKAWDMDPDDPRIALRMMTVELGQGKGRDRLELWFNRAMKLDPNDYDACDYKMLYLEPKWYGSTQDMLAFGRECVQNELWGGRVPLILVDAHKAIQEEFTEESQKTNYWSQPEVWADISSAFDRFFLLNPDETGWYYNYAWYAYHAGQWDAFRGLIPKLGTVDYDFFGGKKSFDDMVALAKAHGGQAPGKD